MESGWSESLPRLQQDVNLWLVGGQGQVRATMILKWQLVRDTHTLRGNVELHALDRNGMPRSQQNFDVFPAPPSTQASAQQFVLTRKDIFGGRVFQGQAPNDQFAFLLDLLRQEATVALALMNLAAA